VRGDAATLARFPKLEIVSAFGVGYDHIDANYAAEHKIVVTNTPDVLTEEVADIAMGLLIVTLREFIKADRYLRSGLWLTQNFPLSVGSLRDRKVGMVGMGRIGQAIARRLDASRVPVVYHTRKPADGLSYKHYPDLIEMAKAVDTLVIIVLDGENGQRRCHEGARPAWRDHQRGTRLGGRRAGLDSRAEVGDHPGRGARRVRQRADGAG
jgi:lactate dehydrogenase-like 2-hydroxyacid dehydrogenase